MDALILLKEGEPFSYVLVLVALIAIGCSIAQLAMRSRDLSGLVLGLLAVLLAMTAAGVCYGLSFFAAVADADPATTATFIARAASSAIAAAHVGGVAGVVASVFAHLATAVAPHRRVEGSLRSFAALAAFFVCARVAMDLSSMTEQIVLADPGDRASIALVGLGEAMSIASAGLCASAVIATLGALAATAFGAARPNSERA